MRSLFTSALAAALLLALAARPALAQDAEPSPAYQALAQRATTAIAEERLDDALMLFRELHAMSPSARTLWSLGRVHFERGEYVLAHDHLRAALDDRARRPLDVAQRASATELLRTASNLIANVELTLTPPSAAVIVDGVQVDGTTLRLDAGSHELRFEAPGHEASTRRLELAGGERTPLAVELTPAGGGASVALLGVLRGQDPEAPREVGVEVRGEQGYRLLLRPQVEDEGSPFGDSDLSLPTEARANVMSGLYSFAVARADGAIAEGSQQLPIAADSVFTIDYVDNSSWRAAGFVMLALGVAGLTALGVGIGLLETSNDPTDRDWGTALTIAGTVGVSLTLITFTMAFIPDEGTARVSPNWDAAGRL